jgi:sugar lactone lactonase YvrE
MKLIPGIFILGTLAGLAGCGGGGSSGGTPPTPTSACSTTTPGNLTVNILNAPGSVTPQITITGPGGYSTTLSATMTLTDIAPGTYTLASTPVAGVSDGIARRAYNASFSVNDVCVGDGSTEVTTASFATIPTSGKLWVGNASDINQSIGYNSTDLFVSSLATVSAAVTAYTKGYNSVAFDKAGNLWTVGGTTTNALITRYPAGAFTASGSKTGDFTIPISAISSSILYEPQYDQLAFDPSGNLWLTSPQDNAIYRFAALSDGTVAATPSVTISNVNNPYGIAFDSAGNLWVAEDTNGNGYREVCRYSQARLSADITSAPNDIITVQDPTYASQVNASAIAFDASHNLWVMKDANAEVWEVYFGDLYLTSGTRTVNAATSVGSTADVGLGMAFDDSGALWVVGNFGQMVKYNVSSHTATWINSADTNNELSFGKSIAFYPAPAGLPLYHSLP